MDGQVTTLSEALLNGLINIIDALIRYIPQLILGFLVLGLGLILAKWARSLVVSGVKSLNLSKSLGMTSLGQFFTSANLEVRLETILGELARWVIIYLFLISALSTFGLNDIADLLKSLLNYIPNLLSALIIFMIGVVTAGFIEQLVKSAFAPVDLSTARLMGKVASYAVVITALIIAIGELGIAKDYILILFAGFVAMIALAFGLAMGLGAKDLIAQVLAKWYRKVTVKTPIKKP